MTNIVALLREAASLPFPGVLPADLELRDRLTAAADELEASAEYALCKWLVEDETRRCLMWQDSQGPWTCAVALARQDALTYGDAPTRSAAIRAALKAWEER